jgi:hypothetical protein
MMAFAKRDEPEQVLVPMIPENRPATRPGTPRAESPTTRRAAGEGCLTFYESCRSGNIGVAITSAEPSDREESSGVPAWNGAAASTASAYQAAAGGAPAETALDDGFLPYGAPDSPPSEDELIGHIMAEDSRRPGAAAAASPSAAMHRPQIDPQLSRIVDAWPNLSSTAREAIAAILDGGPQTAGRIPDAGARGGGAQRRKPTRGKDRAVSDAAEPRRRRTRKTPTPSQ